jgi:diguanylate cyclase (GGDEF)-like protein
MLCRALAVPGDDGTNRLVGSLTDITERKQLEDRLRHGALYDGLTDLPNRVLFVDRLTAAAKHFKRYPDKAFAVLFLDLDGFKDVNDSLGHGAGDLLLARVAERLRGQLRATDTAARIGGDEFAVLLTDLDDLDMVPTIVERIHSALAVPHDIEGHRVVVTASIGIATSGGGHLAPEELLRHSDLAMYRAKTARRGTSATYDISMSSHAEERLLTAHSGAPQAGPR